MDYGYYIEIESVGVLIQILLLVYFGAGCFGVIKSVIVSSAAKQLVVVNVGLVLAEVATVT